ncbi:MAG: hypothetical protein KDK51_00250 [Deltaproteobacteria bacterium]|nr:hypothetical protein [Deltaproteobacteria bacterium]
MFLYIFLAVGAYQHVFAQNRFADREFSAPMTYTFSDGITQSSVQGQMDYHDIDFDYMARLLRLKTTSLQKASCQTKWLAMIDHIHIIEQLSSGVGMLTEIPQRYIDHQVDNFLARRQYLKQVWDLINAWGLDMHQEIAPEVMLDQEYFFTQDNITLSLQGLFDAEHIGSLVQRSNCEILSGYVWTVLQMHWTRPKAYAIDNIEYIFGDEDQEETQHRVALESMRVFAIYADFFPLLYMLSPVQRLYEIEKPSDVNQLQVFYTSLPEDIKNLLQLLRLRMEFALIEILPGFQRQQLGKQVQQANVFSKMPPFGQMAWSCGRSSTAHYLDFITSRYDEIQGLFYTPKVDQAFDQPSFETKSSLWAEQIRQFKRWHTISYF